MSGIIILWGFLTVLAVAVVSLLIFATRDQWHSQDKQADLDYQINQAIDRGDYDEVDRLRAEKIQLMLYGP